MQAGSLWMYTDRRSEQAPVPRGQSATEFRKMRVSRVEHCSATHRREHWNAEAMTWLMRRLTRVPNGNSRPLLVVALALVH